MNDCATILGRVSRLNDFEPPRDESQVLSTHHAVLRTLCSCREQQTEKCKDSLE